MLRQFLAIGLMVFYLAFNSGLYAGLHYCNDKITSVKLFEKDLGHCCHAHHSESEKESKNSIAKDNCCSSEEVFLLVDIPQHLVTVFQVQEIQTLLIEVKTPVLIKETVSKTGVPDSRGSPNIKSKKHIEFQRLTFYG